MKYLFTLIAFVIFSGVMAFSQEKKMESKEEQKKQSGNPIVVMETSMGTIDIELYSDKAPKTVENFLSYVKDKFYDGTIYHRIINNFMIQGGGFSKEGKEKETKAPIINEADNGLKNDNGTIAMARTNDPNSATSQFFINVKDNSFLNFQAKTQQGWGYCVFGKVVNGMDIVNKIKAVKTGTSPMETHGQKVPFQDVPVEQVVIKSVRIKGEKEVKKPTEIKKEEKKDE